MTAQSRELRVRVSAKAKKESVSEKKGIWYVAVKEPAENGRANERVQKLLAAYFSVHEKNVQFVRGRNSHAKIVKVYL